MKAEVSLCFGRITDKPEIMPDCGTNFRLADNPTAIETVVCFLRPRSAGNPNYAKCLEPRSGRCLRRFRPYQLFQSDWADRKSIGTTIQAPQRLRGSSRSERLSNVRT